MNTKVMLTQQLIFDIPSDYIENWPYLISMKTPIRIGLVDDNPHYREQLVIAIKQSPTPFQVILEASNGKEFISHLSDLSEPPDVVIMDVNMPEMNGIETAEWLQRNHPDIKFLVLTLNRDERSIIRMVNAGAYGYLLKTIEPKDLYNSVQKAVEGRYFYNELVDEVYKAMISRDNPHRVKFRDLTTREKEFFRLYCSDMTIKDIAGKMRIDESSIRPYQEKMFKTFGVKSRVGLALLALKNHLV